MTRAAATLAWVSGLGFGIPALFGLRYFVRNDEVWTFMGFPTYGGGPFERWGLPTSVALLSTFAVVCAGELIVGVMLWKDTTVGLWLALLLLPVEMLFWVGFALPIGPLLGVSRTILVVLALAQR